MATLKMQIFIVNPEGLYIPRLMGYLVFSPCTTDIGLRFGKETRKLGDFSIGQVKFCYLCHCTLHSSTADLQRISSWLGEKVLL